MEHGTPPTPALLCARGPRRRAVRVSAADLWAHPLVRCPTRGFGVESDVESAPYVRVARARRCSACPFTPSTPCSTASHAARCTAVCQVTVVVLGARRGQGASGQLPCQLPPRHRRDRWRCKRHRAPALSGGSIVHVVTGIRDTDASRGDATATHVFNTALLLRAVTPVCFPDTPDTPITMSGSP